MNDDEPDSLPIVLGVASLIAALVAWAPVIGFAVALGVALANVDGFGCTLAPYGIPAALGCTIAAGAFSVVAVVFALVSFTRGVRAPNPLGLIASIFGLGSASAALLASPSALFFWGVFNDPLCHMHNMVIGRPLRVRSAPTFAGLRARPDWANGPSPRPIPDAAVRTALADGWAAVGTGEHAAVAAFAKLTLDLLAHGAPAALVRRSLEAALDEVRHAERAFAIASAYAEHPVGPGPLSDGAHTPLATLAADTWTDGVIGEAVSADVLGELAELSPDPAVAKVLREASIDERVHADLARDVVAWACRDRAAAAAVRACPPPLPPRVHTLIPGVDGRPLARRATERALVV